jgi:hypothetical protein
MEVEIPPLPVETIFVPKSLLDVARREILEEAVLPVLNSLPSFRVRRHEPTPNWLHNFFKLLNELEKSSPPEPKLNSPHGNDQQGGPSSGAEQDQTNPA